MSRLALGLALIVAASTAGPARADNDSIATVALGTGLGVHRSAQPGLDAEAHLLSSLNVRLKGFWFLAIDFTWDFVGPAAATDHALEFGAAMRASALVFLVPTEWVGFYLTGGLGARSFEDLVRVDSRGNSYHAGAGLEVHVTDHVTVDGSFLMLLPGSASIQHDIAQRALSAAPADGEDTAPSGAGTQANVNTPGLTDYVSPANFEIMV